MNAYTDQIIIVIVNHLHGMAQIQMRHIDTPVRDVVAHVIRNVYETQTNQLYKSCLVAVQLANCSNIQDVV